MESPIEVLRIEQSVISKELSRFRACDPETRSLYCREWAQYIYKKHFVWNAKTQEEVSSNQDLHTLKAGKYEINFIQDEDSSQPQDCPKKKRSNLMSKTFEQLVESWSVNNDQQQQQQQQDSLITHIIDSCEQWMLMPSGYSGLPTLFEPLEFNPYPDAIPLVDNVKDPSQLLDPLIIERQALCLPSDCFHLLKNLTGDILLSHTTPTCNHTRPESKQPNDIETDRIIFNDHVQIAVKKALVELTLALEQAWHPLNNFLDELKQFEKKRAQLMGKGCQQVIDDFFKGQQYVSFVDFWTTEQAKYKNKKSTPEEIQRVDDVFIKHLEHLKSLVHDFSQVFMLNHLKSIHVLTTDLWKLIVPTIYEMGERMAAHEDNKGNKNTNAVRIGESLKALDMESLKKMESTKEVDAAQKRIMENLSIKIEEYCHEIDEFVKLYRESCRPTLTGRLEKLNHKDFKKKIKKLESGYYSIRQTFRYEVTENIFPESLLCKFSLVCLEPLMQEGEVMEALTIEKEVKRFIESHKDLLQQRCALLHDFEEGVQIGRRELAGILGKLFLKEGMRIQGDNLALKRQNSLLKSMGVATEESTASKKKNKKKKSSAANSGTVSPVPEPTVIEKKPSVSTDKVKPVSSPVLNKKVEPSSKKTTIPAAETVKKVTPKASPVITEKKQVVPVESKSSIVQKEVKKETPAVQKEVKKEAPVVQKEVKKETPVAVAVQKEVKKVQETKKTQGNVVQDRETTQAQVQQEATGWSSIAKKAPETKKEPSVSKAVKNTQDVKKAQDNVVQDWDTLRAEVQQEESGWSSVAKKAPEVKTGSDGGWNKSSTDWSNIAKKKPEVKEESDGGWKSPAGSTDWSAAATGGWNTPVEKKKKDTWGSNDQADAPLVGWNSPVEKKKDAWNSTTNSNDASLGGWGETTSNNDSTSIGGWGEPTKTVESSGWGETIKDKEPVTSSGWSEVTKTKESVSSSGWGEVTKEKESSNTSGWGEPIKKSESDGWRDPKKTGWDTKVKKEDSRLEWRNPKKEDNRVGWNSPAKSDFSLLSSTDGWNDSTKVTASISSGNGWNNNSKWDSNKLPWEDDKQSVETAIKPAVPPGMNVQPTTPIKSSMMPPGLNNNEIKSTVMPPGLNSSEINPSMMPLGLQNEVHTPIDQPKESLNNLMNPMPFVGLNSAVQYQEPLPADLHNMNAEMLLMIVKNLHRENGSLIQSVYNLQQEMNMLTSRYTEIMGLAREREAQTLALYESRKQTEMEEVRRYVLNLESKVKQMEEQLKNNNKTAGFGNQDLFAGYREEMSTGSNNGHHHHNKHGNYRKFWSKNNNSNSIRCGNCGEVGHSSNDCKGICRYCGSQEHLSELCPMN